MDGAIGWVTEKAKHVLDEFQLNIYEHRCPPFTTIVWGKPPDGWLKLDISCGLVEKIRDHVGVVELFETLWIILNVFF